jgi:2-isopropylmalate synthase
LIFNPLKQSLNYDPKTKQSTPSTSAYIAKGVLFFSHTKKPALFGGWAFLFLAPVRRDLPKGETMKIVRKPFFFDVTLRDGNQALKKPWSTDQKIQVFQSLISLGVDGAELGFASASKTDYESCIALSKLAPENLVVSSLSRAVEKEIEISYQSIRYATKSRIHIVFPVSRYALDKVLQIDYKKAKERAIDAVRFAYKISHGVSEIQFSGEHFGDSEDNLDFAIDLFSSVLSEGVNVINLPNTVERTRPFHFVSLVKRVVDALPANTIISVHTHNDLGMATATTVESYFAGATQLEVTLNGLGERAGNTNLYEVACALKNCGESIDLKMEYFYDTAQFISKMSDLPIPEKAPIVGEDIFSHRSGIHQDGVLKTKNESKNIYGAFAPEMVGRKKGHQIHFTSQSGRAAIQEILGGKNGILENERQEEFQKYLKEKSDSLLKTLDDKDIETYYKKFVTQL